MATGISVALAASLFAGCSASPQGTGTLPSSSVSQPTSVHGGPQQFPHHKIGAAELLKLEIAGKLAGPAPRDALKWQLQHIRGKARPQYHFRPDVPSAKAWSDDTEFGYLLGLSKRFKTVSSIDVESNGCYDPVTVKIDHSHNIWAACEYGSSFEAGAAQEYNSAGTLQATYNVGCPTNISPSQCEYFYSDTFDQFENSSYVFASLTSYENCYFVTNYDEQCGTGAGFEYWPAGNPSAQPTLINVTSAGSSSVYEIYYADIDSSGNIWFDYYGCEGSSCGYGIAKITSPTTSPNVVSVAAPGSLEFAGGVYASNGSTRVWVTDQEAGTTTEWTSGTPGTVIGPTKTNVEGDRDPVAGGFNSTDTKLGIGDAYGWADTCTVATNLCALHPSADMTDGAEGFAYQPSDK